MKSIVGSVALLYSTLGFAGSPDCAGPEHWPTSMAFGSLKNADIIKNDELDFAKTKTVRLAYEKIRRDLYRQIHLVTFIKKTGEAMQVITNSDASNEECSISGVEAYLVSKRLGEGQRSNPSFTRER